MLQHPARVRLGWMRTVAAHRRNHFALQAVLFDQIIYDRAVELFERQLQVRLSWNKNNDNSEHHTEESDLHTEI